MVSCSLEAGLTLQRIGRLAPVGVAGEVDLPSVAVEAPTVSAAGGR
jgi:hypothetical protein